MKYNLATILVLLSIVFQGFGQDREKLLANIWKVVKCEEENGKQYKPPSEMQNDYLKFNADYTYESLEYNQNTIKGTWALNENSSMLTMRQTMLDSYPKALSMKILKLTVTELVIEGNDAEGKVLIIYNEAVK
jgi:hypothetical protein